MSSFPSDEDRTQFPGQNLGAGDSLPVRSAYAPHSESVEHPLTTDAGNALPSGMRIGEIEIEAVIAEGSVGIVYRAHDHSLDRWIALKEYLPAMLAARTDALTVVAKTEWAAETYMAGLQSFIDEARLLAQFDHPSLVKVYRFWEANGTAYLIMPLYEGVTLTQTLAYYADPPDEDWLKAVLANLVEPLRIIHAAECIHGDIAPDHILMLKSGMPVLLGFGAARRVIGERMQALTANVEPSYAPIEQSATDESMTRGPWTDIYALAAVAYYSINGAPPVPAVDRIGNDPQRALADTATNKYSAPFLKALDSALSVQPEDRPQSVDAFASELELGPPRRVATGEPVEWVQRSKNLTWFAPALVGLAVIVVALYGAFRYFSPALEPEQQAAPAKPPFDSVKAIVAVYEGRDRDRVVEIALPRSEIRIGKDPLSFTVTTTRDGYLYVIGIGTDQPHLFLLFPNDVDKEHRVYANRALALPRAHWKMIPDGPPGTNYFVAIVSDVPLDFAGVGAVKNGTFLEVPMEVAKLRHETYSGTRPLFAGNPQCGDVRPCGERYGAMLFSVAEIPATQATVAPKGR